MSTFQKNLNIKPKNGKCYSDWTNKETDKETDKDIENYNIDNCYKKFKPLKFLMHSKT